MIRSKILVKWALALAVAMVSTFSLSAQKIGYINLSSLIEAMPEYAKMNMQLDSIGKMYQMEIKSMETEYTKKLDEYKKNYTIWAPAIAQTKENELNQMSTNLQTFQQVAQDEFGNAQKKLLEPIVKKAKEIIAQVAKELGYTYVIDSSSEILLVSSPADDLLTPVKKKLGLVK